MRRAISSTGSTWRWPAFIAGLALVMLFWFGRSGLDQLATWMGSALSGAGNWVGISIGGSQTKTSENEVAQLRRHLGEVTQELRDARQQIETLGALETLDAFLAEHALRTIRAAVIAYSPDPGVASLVIQRGRDHGVAEGMAVITEQGLVVGLVARSDQSSAVVRLLTDTQSRILGQVQNQERSRGLVLGLRGLSLRMQFLPQHDKVTPGQTVVTSGLDARIPPDLLIATVEKAEANPGELFQSADLISAVEFTRLRVLAVVLGRQ